MRIRRVEIVGFKSFCDKTTLLFDQPISAVVGPNGCGKSNIVDAIRWCMGEQSAHKLRGKSMEDVIFNGSDTRGPMGMAEVSLTFTNDDGQVLPQYAAYPEIVVTRRLFRDGLSEYLINKTSVRLRDVVDLFLGTGVSSKAYSVIEQGRIGLVVSSKPEDRRHLIEEAAGITKYKQLRQSAERKMEATRQNLLRLSDVCGEMEQRLGSLKRQAQKAERYRRYRTEMKDLDLWGSAHKYLGFMAEEKVAQAALTRAREEQEETRRELERRELDLERRRLEAVEVERALSGLQERLYEIDNQIRLTESSMEFQGREATEIDERVAHARQEIVRIEEQLEETSRQSEAAQESVEALLSSCREESEQLAASEEQYAAARDQLTGVQREIDETKGAQSALGAAIARHENHLEGLSARQAELETRRDRLVDEAGHVDAQLGDAQSETSVLEEKLGGLRQLRLALGEQRESHEARIVELKERVAASDDQLETLRTELHRRRSRLTSLAEIAQRYEGFQRGVRAIMQHDEAPREGVRGLVADIIDPPAEYEAAVEALLGERLGNIIVNDHEAGLRAIEFLKARAEGRSSFIPMDVRLDHRRPAGDEASAPAAAPVSVAGAETREAETSEVATDGMVEVRPTVAARTAMVAVAPVREESALEMAAADHARFEEVIRRVARAAGLRVDLSEPPDHAESPEPQESDDRAAAIRRVTSELGASSPYQWPEGPGVRGPLLDLCPHDEGYSRIADLLLGDALVMEDLDAALTLWRREGDSGALPTLVTLDGDLIDPHGVVTGGAQERVGAGVLQQRREMRDLEELISDLESEVAEAEQRHRELRDDLRATVKALESLTRDTHSGEIDILTHEKDLGRGREEVERLAERRWSIDAERGEVERLMDEAAGEADRTARELGEAQARLTATAERLAALASTGEELLQRVDGAAQRVTELKVQVAMAQEKHVAAQQRLESLATQAQEHAERRAKLVQGIEEGEVRAAELRAEVELSRARLLELSSQSADLNEELTKGRADYEERQAEMQHEEAGLRGLRRRSQELSEESQGLELKAHDLAATRGHLEETVAERYRVELRREVPDYHLRPRVGEAEEARVQELRRLIDRMGEVNLTAIEEYDELSQRYEFKSKQKADVEQALDQVQRAITKINRTSRQRFKETFEAVNAKFQEVFPRLFKGGRARLQLTDESDLLETGVEIIAQPPGKKLQSIDLLSGGEKALTAVSMVFAIFLVKPSPFCVLDEVDAPLDDANVGRFNDMIRDMTDRSQFIMITHNKRTMAVADQLYGVTMQEPGVSQLVSVKLSQQQRASA